LDEAERKARTSVAARSLMEAGADYVADTAADLGPALEAIAERIRAGERPAGA
jgi:phosphonoacetaldehyde hydrolase